MTKPTTLADTILDIDLRWTLRDIRANRTLLLAAKQDQIGELVRRGWAEMQEDLLVVTQAGLGALDVY